MPSAGVIALGAVAAMLYFGGGAVRTGVVKVTHKIVHVLKHQPKTAPPAP